MTAPQTARRTAPAAHPAPGSGAVRNARVRSNGWISRAVRRFHFCLGAVLTINFVVLVVTGLLIQHRTFFRLEERTISRAWLPGGYRAGDPGSEIRADIVITDLHSGKLFGPKGPLVVDAAAGGLLLMIASGYIMQLACRYRNRRKDF